jgi:hypothetical protein
MRAPPLLLFTACAGVATLREGDSAADGDADAPEDGASATPADGEPDAPLDTGGGAPEASDCPPVTDATRTVVVTDIDETLTTSDNEWLTQIAIPGTDPAMRPAANRLMQDWEARGYRIIYLTARGEGLRLLDGQTAREATVAWLRDHDFPFRPRDVFLADGVGALFGEAEDYKTQVLNQLKRDGFELSFAYGNADTDIWAFQNAGIADDHQWLVGDLAGTMRANPLPSRLAFRAHRQQWPGSAPCGH